MFRRTPLLQIDGQPLPEPTQPAEIDFTDMESSDSGPDESGVYHRIVIRFGILSCTLTYDYLDNRDCAYLMGLLRNKNTFQFTCPVASEDTDVSHTITRTCYCTNHGAALQRLKAGFWRNMTLNIQEC